MAVATDAMICTINFKVSFLLIILTFFIFYILGLGWGLSPKPLVSDRLVTSSTAGIAATSVSTGIAATTLAAAT
jgi:hypothetical protein